ncbi:MAG: helix-turn-helix transcriptional regulator, partial [Phycisphaerales bacterium]|nr:helix-turn-helix transcriptional regulator [Phycisphaerales bacterium]
MTNQPTSEGARRRQPLVRTGAREREEPWSLRLTDAETKHLSSDLAVLTDREREVVFAICSGGPNEAVAERLYIALPTLRTHLMRVNQKLGTRSKADVVRFVVGRLLESYRASGSLPSRDESRGESGTGGASEIEVKTRGPG